MDHQSDTQVYTRPTLVEVWAPACSSCKAMEPDLQQVAQRFDGSVDLIQLNATTDREAVGAMGVMGTPTIIGYREGEEVFRHIGRRSGGELEQLFAALDAGDAGPRVGTQDLILRAGAGAALAGVGFATGPTWILVGIGVAAAVFGIVTWLRSGAR